MQVPCSTYSSTSKMDAIYSFETSVDFKRTRQHYVPEYSTVCNHWCENLKSLLDTNKSTQDSSTYAARHSRK
jgi:hypothetical protein